MLVVWSAAIRKQARAPPHVHLPRTSSALCVAALVLQALLLLRDLHYGIAAAKIQSPDLEMDQNSRSLRIFLERGFLIGISLVQIAP